jgi:hypothetical protein
LKYFNFKELKVGKIVLLISFVFAFSAQAFVQQAETQSAVSAPDYSQCTWNVWVSDASQLQNVESLLQQNADILDVTRTETGLLIIEANYRDKEGNPDAAAAAHSVVEALNQIPGVQVVCQVDHSNPQPRLSGGT